MAGCFSFYPLKTLNACGDGGAITTNDSDLYERLSKARNHGLRNRDECEFWSYNSRLGTLQAAILNVKLRYLDQWTAQRRAIAVFYRQQLADVMQVPEERPYEFSVYHTFMVQTERRSDLQHFLAERGIGTRVHYPIPIHLQEAAGYLDYRPGDFPVTERLSRCILSLPIYPELTDAQREAVVTAIKSFYG